jgi:hypothetical protein
MSDSDPVPAAGVEILDVGVSGLAAVLAVIVGQVVESLFVVIVVAGSVLAAVGVGSSRTSCTATARAHR